MAQFDLIVVGSGTGNSIIDERFAGKSVALVERSATFGGTCLNAGCIPTKMFVYPADVMATAAGSSRLGLDVPEAHADWAAIRDRIFGRIDPISTGGRAWRESNENVTLYDAEARFLGPHMLAVGEDVITGTDIVLATGSSARIPELPGIHEPGVAERIHTSDSIMRLEEFPSSIIILGGGFIAAEFAHIFAAYGSKVTILYRGSRLLRHEDDDISEAFTAELGRRCTLRFGHQLRDVQVGHRGVSVGTVDAQGIEYEFEAEQVLLALGRTPNSADLDPAAGGVDVDEDGFVVVDEYQRTSAPGVWAFGDVSSRPMLKHVANLEGRTVAHNLLHPDDLVASDHRFVPHAVFSGPCVASVGLTEREAAEQGLRYSTFTQRYADVAYGWAMEDDGHVVKLVADRGTGMLLGAHILGPQASVLIQPLIQAMSTGLDARTMARGQYWIHPSLSEVVENALLGLDVD
ncbi:mycothione reductase [Propionicicella superfundia]|uniref:mycothione reductase n=1 Tax=Propionicicella superfundia TaxID=348582 RepID=UPI00041FD39D|nr:mycothione reductase [Propionicicella superfundia]